MDIEIEKLLEKTKEDYFAEKNDDESFKNFLEIYEKTGNEEAEFFLGEMYYLGYGTEQNLEKAYQIMNKLFDKDRRAKEKIASMYIDGIYVEQDNDKAFQIYKTLVEDGEDSTGYDNYMLGLCYKDGYGTDIDLKKAFELIKKGAYNLSEFSKEKLGEENYNAIIDAKDEFIDYTKQAIDIIGDVGSNIFENGKEYIKNWYENLKRD